VIHRYVDNAAVSGRQHPRGHLPRDQEIAGQVGVHDGAEAVRGNLPEALRLGQESRIDRAHADPGVVDQHADPAQARRCLVHGPANRGLVAHVEFEADGSRQACGGLPGPFAGPAGQGDGRAGLGQGGGHGQAQPVAAAGDEDALRAAVRCPRGRIFGVIRHD